MSRPTDCVPEPGRAERGVLRVLARAASCDCSAAPTAARGATRRAIAARSAARSRCTWEPVGGRGRVFSWTITHRRGRSRVRRLRTRSSSSSSRKGPARRQPRAGSSRPSWRSTSRSVVELEPVSDTIALVTFRPGLTALPAVELWELVAREAIRETVASYAPLRRLRSLRRRGRAVRGRRRARGPRRSSAARVARRDPRLPRRRRTATSSPATVPMMRHHVSNVHDRRRVADRSDRGARYFIVVTEPGVDHWGRYRDRLHARRRRWLFAHRLVRTDGRTPGGWAAGGRLSLRRPRSAGSVHITLRSP